MLGPSVQRFHETSGMPIGEIYDVLRKAQPVQRLGTVEEIGKAYMTGALLSVDGGYTCQ